MPSQDSEIVQKVKSIQEKLRRLNKHRDEVRNKYNDSDQMNLNNQGIQFETGDRSLSSVEISQ